MSLGLIVLVFAVFLWLTAQYWLAPLATRAGQRVTPLVPELEPVAEPDVDPRFGGVLEQHRVALEKLGFVATTPLVSKGPGAQGWVQLFEHPLHGDVATVIAVPDSRQPLPVNLVGFTSMVGGVRLRTGNSPLPSTFPTPPGTESARFPEERDAARLYALHRARVKRLGERSHPIRIGDPVVYQQREEAEGYKYRVDSGYFFHDGSELRPTWKGAVCMPYRLLFPWKHIRELRDEWLRRRLLPEAGLA